MNLQIQKPNPKAKTKVKTKSKRNPIPYHIQSPKIQAKANCTTHHTFLTEYKTFSLGEINS